MLENISFKKLVQSNLNSKLPELTLSGFTQYDSEDLATFTTLTHLTKIQSFFLQPSAMPIVNLIPKLTNLRDIHLTSTKIVVEPNLFLHSLTNLTYLGIQIQTSKHIKAADLANMTQLKSVFLSFQQDSEFPTSLLQLPDLHHLRFKKILTIPPIITNFSCLRELELDYSTHEFPSELELMTQLRKIKIRASESMTKIPDVIFKMTWLSILSLSLLSNVRYLHPNISRLEKLNSFVLTHSGLVTIPQEDLAHLTQLHSLNIMGLSCKWVPPQLPWSSGPFHIQGGSNIPPFWQDQRRFKEFSQVHLDLYNDC